MAISLDGTCTLMVDDGWREAMVGTLAFYDADGERQHTIYPAATPEYGKAKFLGHLESEIERAKLKCPDAHYIGIADGARGNWRFLERHADVQVTDSSHAAEYLGEAAVVLYRGHPRTKEAWLEEACHRLKHDVGGAGWVLRQLRRPARERPWAKGHEDVQRAITDFANQGGRPDELCRAGGGERADRQRGDGGGVQGDRQAAAVRLGDEVDGGWRGGDVEPADVELYTGAMGGVPFEGRSVGFPVAA